MMMQLSIHQWQILRKILRKGIALPGKDLRLQPSRKTRDGKFLTDLVKMGLLEVVRVGGGITPFEDTYNLTNPGEIAAEYGEFNLDLESGKAAEVQEPNDNSHWSGGTYKPAEVHSSGKAKKGRKVLAGRTSR